MATLTGHTKAAPVAWTRAARLADFDPRSNSITPVRLALALTVVASHSIYIGGFGVEPLVRESNNTTSLGFAAVLGFFTLSGFLLAGSRERTGRVAFARNRALRILPGYWLSLGFVVLAALIASGMTGIGFGAADAAGYVLPRMAFLSGPDAPLRAAMDGATLNGSLWTLAVESFCYVLLALVPVRWIAPVAAGEAVGLLVGWVFVPWSRGAETALLFAFAIGVLAWTYRSRVPVSIPHAGLGAAVVALGLGAGFLPMVAAGIGYLCLAAAWLPVRMHTDLSYGVYVLAYPMTTLLAMAGFRALGPVGFAGVAMLAVLPLAWLSWTCVERQALRFKSLGAVGRSPATAR